MGKDFESEGNSQPERCGRFQCSKISIQWRNQPVLIGELDKETLNHENTFLVNFLKEYANLEYKVPLPDDQCGPCSCENLSSILNLELKSINFNEEDTLQAIMTLNRINLVKLITILRGC